MGYYCGIVTINHKKYRVYYHPLYQEFKFYHIIHNELCEMTSNIYTRETVVSEIKQHLFIQNMPSYKPRKNPFNKCSYTPSLTEEEYKILLTALDRNSFLKEKEKTIIKELKSLILHTPCHIKELYDRYATLRIIKYDLNNQYNGIYLKDINTILLKIGLDNSKLLFTLFHELIHVHQVNAQSDDLYLFDFFIEGFTEITAFEVLKSVSPDLNHIHKIFADSGYIHEINVCNILCEILNPSELQNKILDGSERLLEEYVKSIMTTEEFYEIFGKMTLYFNRVSFKQLDVYNLLGDVYDRFADIALRICIHDSDKINRIISYLDKAETNEIIHLTNYILPENQKKKILFTQK